MKEKVRSIVELVPPGLEEMMISLGEPAFRARQITNQLFRRLANSYEEMTDIPVRLREKLSKTPLHSLEPVHLATSEDGTVKGLFSLPDGNTIEAALMLYRRSGSESRRATVCVSTQVGCAVGCPFCATGGQGFTRNLTAGEIIDQVLYFCRYLRDNAPGSQNGKCEAVTNIVFMGMGEPLANYDELVKAIRVLNAPDGLGLGARSMTVSTSGLPDRIRTLAEEGLQVGLAVSLHAGTDEVRNRLVPLNRKYPLTEVVKACKDYFRISGRRVSFEYVLFKGVNDSLSEARALARLIHGMNCHVNLIPANDTGSREYQPPPQAGVTAFLQELKAAHITTTIRHSRGRDIDAGCGQLRSRLTKKG